MLHDVDDLLGLGDGVARLIDADSGPTVVRVGATGFELAERAPDLAANPRRGLRDAENRVRSPLWVFGAEIPAASSAARAA